MKGSEVDSGGISAIRAHLEAEINSYNDCYLFSLGVS